MWTLIGLALLLVGGLGYYFGVIGGVWTGILLVVGIIILIASLFSDAEIDADTEFSVDTDKRKKDR